MYVNVVDGIGIQLKYQYVMDFSTDPSVYLHRTLLISQLGAKKNSTHIVIVSSNFVTASTTFDSKFCLFICNLVLLVSFILFVIFVKFHVRFCFSLSLCQSVDC